MAAKMYYEKDVDPSIIRGRKVAIIGACTKQPSFIRWNRVTENQLHRCPYDSCAQAQSCPASRKVLRRNGRPARSHCDNSAADARFQRSSQGR